VSVVSDQEGHLRSTRVLIAQLAGSPELWLESLDEANRWLADFDKPSNDATTLLKRAYLFFFGVESAHKAVPSLSEENARAVSAWLTDYLGKEERE